MDHYGRGASGFRWIEITNSQKNTRKKIVFSQNFPYLGEPTRVRKWQNQQLLSDTSFIYQNRQSNNVYSTWLKKQTVHTHSPENIHLSTVITNFSEPDDYGNIERIENQTDDKINDLTWRTETNNTYQNNPTTWVLGRLTQSEVTHYKTGLSPISKTTQFEYDNRGILIKEIIEPNANNSLYKAISYQYDSYGNKTVITTQGKDYRGQMSNRTINRQVSFTTYNGKPVRKVTIENELNQKDTLFYNLIYGKLQAKTDPNSLTTSWQYDILGRKIRENQSDGSWTMWSYESSQWNNAEYQNTQQNSQLQTIVSYFDNYARKIRTVTTAVDGREIYSDTQYDHLGRKTFVSRPYFSGDPVYGTTFHYDEFSRLTHQDDPDTFGQTKQTHYHYGAFENTTIDSLGRQKTLYFDAKGKTIKSEEGVIITHQYDPLNRLIATNNAKGQQTTIEYDNRGRKTAINDPVMGYWSYQYDGFDNLIKQTDSKGQIITTQYDLLNRKTRQTSSGGDATWTYDTASGKGIGKLHQATSPLGFGEIYSYDQYGRLSNTKTQWQGNNYNTQIQYDHLSRAKNITYPSGLTVNNVYSTYGHLIAIQSPKNQVIDYDADFIIKQFIKAQQFAELATIEAEKYQQQAELYQGIVRSYTTNTSLAGWQMLQNRKKAQEAINELETLSQQAIDISQQMESQSRSYREKVRTYKNWLYKNYQDHWTNGSDYLEAQAELEYLKAQKYLQNAQENLEILQAFENMRNYIKNNSGARMKGGNYIYYILGSKKAAVAVKTLKEFQQKAKHSLLMATTLQEKQNNFMAMLGSNAQDQDNLTWYRIAQSDSEGRISQALYGNGLFSSWHYDPSSGQLLSLQTGNATNGNYNDIQYLNFQYDSLNNLTQKDDYILNRSEQMSYDNMDRIVNHSVVTSDNSWNHNYTYNDHGDILYGPAGQYLYGDREVQKGVLLSVNGQNLSYDKNGNITRTANGTTIAYNLNNKPTYFSKGNHITGFAYDGNGNRFLKTINGVSSLYIGKIYEENLNTGDQTNHIYFGNQQIASYEKRSNGRVQTSYLHKDALGNIDTITNQYGDILKRYSYDAFGKRHELSTHMTHATEGKQSGFNLLPLSNDIKNWKHWGWYTNNQGQREFAIESERISETGGPLGIGYFRTQTKGNEGHAWIYESIAKNQLTPHGNIFTFSIWIKSANGEKQSLRFLMNIHGGSDDGYEDFEITDQWQRLNFTIDISQSYRGSINGPFDAVQFQIGRQNSTDQSDGSENLDFYIAGAMLTPGTEPANWSATKGGIDDKGYTYTKPTVDRGYTGHEHFTVGDDPSNGFIHMNGRVYDPTIGRFTSPDSIVPNPYLAVAFNRYAYVYNNPFKYHDPSGHYPSDHGYPDTPGSDPVGREDSDGNPTRGDDTYHRDNPFSYNGTVDYANPPIYGPPRKRQGLFIENSEWDIHGNFAGIGHYADDLYPNPSNSPYEPIDEMDEKARKHDIDYYQQKIQWSLTHKNPERQKIDDEFVATVNEIDKSNFTIGEKIYAIGINAIFGGFFYDSNKNNLTDDDYYP